MPPMAFDELREDYQGEPLFEVNCAACPTEQFRRWFDDAVSAEIPLVNAMTLATVDANGWPQSRIVLLKEVDETGFVFYTNYLSRKGRELEQSHRASVVFWWHPLNRQVRIVGTVQRVSGTVSDAYFSSRPKESNIVAIASAQSEVVASREAMEQRITEVKRKLGDRAPQRPEHWGGYCLVPHGMEFWQGRPDRSHDRLEYRKDVSGNWYMQRLLP